MDKKRYHLFIPVFKGLKIKNHAPHIYLPALWKVFIMLFTPKETEGLFNHGLLKCMPQCYWLITEQLKVTWPRAWHYWHVRKDTEPITPLAVN